MKICHKFAVVLENVGTKREEFFLNFVLRQTNFSWKIMYTIKKITHILQSWLMNFEATEICVIDEYWIHLRIIVHTCTISKSWQKASHSWFAMIITTKTLYFLHTFLKICIFIFNFITTWNKFVLEFCKSWEHSDRLYDISLPKVQETQKSSVNTWLHRICWQFLIQGWITHLARRFCISQR